MKKIFLLKQLRKEEGLTQEFVANKLGIHTDTLRKIENGEGSLKVEHLPIISELFAVDVQRILCEFTRK